MSKPRRGKKSNPSSASREDRPASEMRIIGGSLRGSKIHYSGRFDTRPMKDRLREAIFNLVGPAVKGKHAIDLFAGTGALGLEALSRGAVRATFVERHVPTARLIQDNVARLGLGDRSRLAVTSAFVFAKRDLPADGEPWLVFLSPPYAFFDERRDEMSGLIAGMANAAPPESILIVEGDERFDPTSLPDPAKWQIRQYLPATVALLRKEAAAPA